MFVVRDGVRRARRPESSGCLLGVTRALVLELAAELGIAVEESALPLDALRDADEAFLTSTTREVQAIAHVDGRALPAAPGPVTATARHGVHRPRRPATSTPESVLAPLPAMFTA